jgi:hypothetical protein
MAARPGRNRSIPHRIFTVTLERMRAIDRAAVILHDVAGLV